MKRLVFGFLSTALLALGLVAGAAPAAASTTAPTIVGIASTTPGFSTLTAAATCTGLVPVLNGPAHLTVFAPTDAAFAKLGLNKANVCSALPRQTLTAVLLYHVTPGDRSAQSLLPRGDEPKTVWTLAGQPLEITADARILTTSGGQSRIVATDIRASNGIIHVIDSVLLPGQRGFEDGEDDD